MTATAAAVLAFWLTHAQPFQAHALLRLAAVESNTTADPKTRGTGHCLYQWTGHRWRQLRNQAASAGCPPLVAQLEFALMELRSPTYACFWHAPPAQAYAVLRRTFGHGGRCR